MEKQNKQDCKLLVAIDNGKEILCGDSILGKKRYCINCSTNADKENNQVTKPHNKKSGSSISAPPYLVKPLQDGVSDDKKPDTYIKQETKNGSK